jgi:hypothetical protein
MPTNSPPIEMLSLLFSWQGVGFFVAAVKFQYLLQDIADPWSAQLQTTAVSGRAKRQLSILQKLFLCNIEEFGNYWNGYEIHNGEQLTELCRRSGCLLVGYHSRPTIDLVYLFAKLKPRIIVHYLAFKVPVLREILTSLGVVSSRQDGYDLEQSFVETVTSRVNHSPVILLPGGRFECIKSYDQRYQVLWKDIPGFVRVLCEHRQTVASNGGVTILPFFTAQCEDAYWHSPWTYDTTKWLADSLYESFLAGNTLVMPIMLTTMLCSLGFLLLPRRVKLDTYIGEPITLKTDEEALDFARRIKSELQSLMNRHHHDHCSQPRDASLRLVTPTGCVDHLVSSMYGMYTLVQNATFVGVLLAAFWVAAPGVVVVTSVSNLLSQRRS